MAEKKTRARSVINRKTSRIRRSRSVKGTLPLSTTQVILRCATDLMCATVSIHTSHNHPTVEHLRKLVEPAYRKIATHFSALFDAIEGDITANTLSGLHVDMNPTYGSYSVRVNHKQPDGRTQPFTMYVQAADGLNVFLRQRDAIGLDAAYEFSEAI